MSTALGNPILNDVARAALRLQGSFRAAGVEISIHTDSISVLCAAEELFERSSKSSSVPRLTLQVATDARCTSLPPWPKPAFRVDGSQFHVEFGAGNALLMDPATGMAQGSVGPAMAHDVNYWRLMVLPAFFGTLCYAAGTCILHCACLAREGNGILLAAPSGTGKSTLCYALAKRGYDYLSDDWTYLYRDNGQLLASGLPLPMKLLADCGRWFPELEKRTPAVTLNGETAYELDAEAAGLGLARCCEPQLLLLLDRRGGDAFRVLPLSAAETLRRFQQDFQDLPECFTGYDALLQNAARDLANRGALVASFAAEPNAVAAEVDRLFRERLAIRPRFVNKAL
jgi:hypothetical protein